MRRREVPSFSNRAIRLCTGGMPLARARARGHCYHAVCIGITGYAAACAGTVCTAECRLRSNTSA